MSTEKIRCPAEWEPQEATLLTWPHARSDWAKNLLAVENVYVQYIQAITQHQKVYLNTYDLPTQERALKLLSDNAVDLEHVRCFVTRTNDTWIRDYGPITVFEGHQRRILHFGFNAWGEKYPFDLDAAVPQTMHAQEAFGTSPLQSLPLILEGGSIDSDGCGTLLTTERCLGAPTRNPSLTREELEASLRKVLGVDRLLWLKNAFLAGDDTDGHIDMLARWLNPTTVAVMRCEDKTDEHFASCHAMIEELQAFRAADGSPYRVIEFPFPSRVNDEDGHRLPLSYMNFLFVNEGLIVPVYNVPEDEAALALFKSFFPERVVHPVHALPIVQQHGSLHCLSMQLPKELRA